ncbi:MAG: PaaI family thioesterase [Actinomycetota bacterium]|nr:PaaI family thioesterase [Actinomycetota bacterium]
MTERGEKDILFREITRQRSDPSIYYGYLGMKLEELGEGTSRFRMPVSSRLFNSGGVVHGGALASIAAAAAAAALATLVDPASQDMFTVEMKINFLAPARDGDIVAQAEIVQRGRSVAVGESLVYDGEGRLLAKAMATYLIRERKKDQEKG